MIAYDSILYSDVEPVLQYSPVKLHLSPATRILSENSDRGYYMAARRYEISL